jgi:GT2 family glycosyltransferase
VTDLSPPAVADPTVSVVMATYNAWDWTRRALAALVANTPDCYELIVVDNGSTDATREGLSTLANARVVEQDSNTGFAAASNTGAALARAEYLVFLNSDALVEPGWLPPLLAVAELDARAGAVAPRLLNMDGSLQEAGALVARTGATAQYGLGDAPTRLEYAFRRAVDYAGATCLLVRRSAFEAVGGFDDAYRPAYYEDADLCFALRAAGWRTLYQPRSTVRHGVHGSGDKESAEASSERNRRRFAARWRDELAARPPSLDPARPRRVVEARDAPAFDRILVIGSPDAARRSATTTAARALAAELPYARVTLAAPDAAALPLEDVLADGVEVAAAPGWPGWLEGRRLLYDAIVFADADDLRVFEPSITRTQAQAVRIELAGPQTLAQRLADAGVAAVEPWPVR